MFSIYKQLMEILDRREKIRFFILMTMIVIMGILDMVGVAVVLPFLAVAADPSTISTNPWLAWFSEMIGVSDERQFLIVLGTIVFLVVVGTLLFRMTTLFAMTWYSNRRRHSIAMRFVRGYMRQNFTWFKNHHTSRLMKTIMGDTPQFVGMVVGPLLRIVAQSISLFFLIVLLLILNPIVAISAAVVLGGIYALIFLLVRDHAVALGNRTMDVTNKLQRSNMEMFQGIKDVKISGLEYTYVQRAEQLSYALTDANTKSTIIGEMPRQILETVAYGGMLLLVIILLSKEGSSFSDILPVLGVFALAGMRMFPALQQIYHSLTALRGATAVREAIYTRLKELERSGAPQIPSRSGERLPLNKEITLEGIEYSYPESKKKILRGVDMTIKAKSTVGIVGGTGAGKTTILDVLLGLLQPSVGQVRIDGELLTDETLEKWQSNIGYIPQQIFVVADTISANIAFGIPESKRNKEAIEAAAHKAELHNFIMEDLTDGYESVVGEQGGKISGGQKQRVGIARALYHDPDVLVMDEATSALDNITERAVMSAVQNLARTKTIIMIAHRLSTVRNCDKIFFMDKGRVVATGTFEELVATNANFAELAKEA